jgi:hypothetical protein
VTDANVLYQKAKGQKGHHPKEKDHCHEEKDAKE